jgi:hypothetical protein
MTTDIYPHTDLGRVVALGVMLIGIGCIAILTAALDSLLLESAKRWRGEPRTLGRGWLRLSQTSRSATSTPRAARPAQPLASGAASAGRLELDGLGRSRGGKESPVTNATGRRETEVPAMPKASIRATLLALPFLSAAAILAAGCGSKKAMTTAKTTTTTSAAKKTSTKSYALKATLSTAQEAPRAKDAAAGAGSFTATITLKGTTGTLAWHLLFAHLSGPATAAHVHLGPPGTAGPIAIPLCAPCKPNSHGSFTGPIGGNVRLLHALLGGATYVNVHTKLNPQGEIRGQIKATPTSRSAGGTTTGGTTTSSGY